MKYKWEWNNGNNYNRNKNKITGDIIKRVTNPPVAVLLENLHQNTDLVVTIINQACWISDSTRSKDKCFACVQEEEAAVCNCTFVSLAQ